MIKLKDLLKNDNTLNKIIIKLNSVYDLDKNIGIMSKSIVINGLDKIIKILNIKKR
tara:strand:+ start:2172 stop:2339 length:168 start_codon:yes stop_codon:yes gene_type:complete